MPTTSTWIVTAIAACSDPASDGASGSPSLAVETTLIFDGVHIGMDLPAVEQVWVENVGDGTLFVEAPYFAEDSAFTVSRGSVTLEPMEGHAYDVTFDPQIPFVHEASLVFKSDDPKGPLRAVTVRGEGFAPVLDVTTSPIDFGVPAIGCLAPRGLEVHNSGNETLEMEATLEDSTSSEFGVPAPYDAFEIEPGLSMNVDLGYRPADATPDSATLVLRSNDPLLPETAIELAGAGKLGNYSEFFDVKSRASDIVLVVDNSASMDIEQPQLVDHLGAFVAELDDAAVDYRIAVITTDNGGFRGNVVTPGRPLAMLADQVEAGTEGSGTTRALQMLYNCVQAGADCSEIAGFLRDDALFVGIILSDDPDQSALTPEDYVEHFWTLKDDPELVRIHALAGAIPLPSCATCASAGFGYDQAQELTGGVYLDICTEDWDEAFSTLAEQSSPPPPRVVQLSQDPVVDTIEVSVDGVPQLGGWSYTGHVADGGTNEVEFDDPLPVPSVVGVSYTLTAACE